MKWNVLNDLKDPEQILDVLLNNRGLSKKNETNDFLSPKSPENLTPLDVGIDPKQTAKAIKRIEKAVGEGEPIVVYGDYDADGICSTAILWETLRDLGAKVMPFIPLREKEGYGLSREGIDSILSDPKYAIRNTKYDGGLIISVDSGIVAHEAIDYAKERGIDAIILDHHEIGESLPNAHAIVHTTQLCAAGISFIFAKELFNTRYNISNTSLELATIATITDLMPLLGPNRSIVKFGLESLNKTTRPGLRALFSVAGLERVSTYEVGFMIGPRINASGRIENALLALRMLCTKDFTKALEYAQELNQTNKQRQDMTLEMTMHAISKYDERSTMNNLQQKIIVIEHESYHQGIIGLIAGKLVEKYYLPSIVIAKGKDVSKASARSISGFNIIEAIRSSNDLLLGAGGHPMAAGFSIETTRIEEFKLAIGKVAMEKITDDLLERQLRIDCELDLTLIDMDLYKKLNQFAPFGIGNPEPTFCAEAVVQNLRTVGQEGKHLKLTITASEIRNPKSQIQEIDCIAFGKGSHASELKTGDKVKIAYTIDLNTYNGISKLQLKIRDIKHGGVTKSNQAI
jgi:single-stranded-DNA-specific exonuclease